MDPEHWYSHSTVLGTTHLYLELEVELEVWLSVEFGQQVHQTHSPGTGRLENLLSHVDFLFYSRYNSSIIKII
jgi:hypothetical protein